MELYYAVNCGKDCEYYSEEHKNEDWKNAKLYGKELQGYSVSNFGGIMKNDANLPRKINAKGEICVKIDEKEIELYKIVASSFLPEPDGGYEDNGNKKAVHHRDNNSYNFNPDNMKFLTNEKHQTEFHLKLQNIIEWSKQIEEICKK